MTAGILGHGLNSAASTRSAKLRPPFNRELVRCLGKLFPALGEIEIASTNCWARRPPCHDQALFGVDSVHLEIFGHDRRAQPVRIVAFNTAAGWSRDVTEEIAREIENRAARSGEELSPGLVDFIDYQIERAKRLSLAASP